MPGERPTVGSTSRPSCLEQIHRVVVTRTEESSAFRAPMTDECWSDAVRDLERQIDPPRRVILEWTAKEISLNIQRLDVLMNRYCEATCPSCDDPCCDGRRVFYNRADLLYLIGTGDHLPPGQTRRTAGEACRYLTPRGCVLPREKRPYVCVWFLCEPQMELFQAEKAATQRKTLNTFLEIRSHRLRLESLLDWENSVAKGVHLP
jgi:hypothetical protein